MPDEALVLAAELRVTECQENCEAESDPECDIKNSRRESQTAPTALRQLLPREQRHN